MVKYLMIFESHDDLLKEAEKNGFGATDNGIKDMMASYQDEVKKLFMDMYDKQFKRYNHGTGMSAEMASQIESAQYMQFQIEDDKTWSINMPFASYAETKQMADEAMKMADEMNKPSFFEKFKRRFTGLAMRMQNFSPEMAENFAFMILKKLVTSGDFSVPVEFKRSRYG